MPLPIIAGILLFSIALLFYLPVQHGSPKTKKLVLLIASWLVYALYNPWCLLLLIAVSGMGYIAAIQIRQQSNNTVSKTILSLAIILMLLPLLAVKYTASVWLFIAARFATAPAFGNATSVFSHIIQPLGISFYTFQSVGYLLDIYNKRTAPEKSLLNYFLYISFFPQIPNGPIARTNPYLVQFRNLPLVSEQHLVTGTRLVLWGLTKKFVFADNIGSAVDYLYGNSEAMNSLWVFISSILFMYQLYLDIDSYTDIARGVARMFGIELIKNFNYPFYSYSLSEYWSKFHISVTSWFKDYVFVPLFIRLSAISPKVFSKKISYYFSILLLFIVIGLWHQASLSFLVLGLSHGTVIILEDLAGSFFSKRFIAFSFVKKLLAKIIFIFNISWLVVIFRAVDLHQTSMLLCKLFSFNMIDSIINLHEVQTGLILFGSYLVIEFLLYKKIIQNYFQKLPISGRWIAYLLLIAAVLYFGHFTDSREFIYRKY